MEGITYTSQNILIEETFLNVRKYKLVCQWFLTNHRER